MNIDLGFLTQSSLFADTFTLKIEASGVYDSLGDFTQGVITEYTLTGSVEPVSGIDRTNDISGARSHETIMICTNREQLSRALRQGITPTNGDLIVYEEQTYRISNVSDWRTHGFLDIEAIRVNESNDI